MKNKLIALSLLLILLAVFGVLLIKRLNVADAPLHTTSQNDKKTDKDSGKPLRTDETSETTPTPTTTTVPMAKTSVETDTSLDDLDKNIDSLNNSLDDLNL